MNDDARPFISIIVAIFNGGNTLQQCIDSVNRQVFQDKELIVIDGGSQDSTIKILEANRDAIEYWISEPDRGIYDAWNKGLRQAKGEWICFMGADDYLLDESVLDRIAIILRNLPSSINVAYGKVKLINAEGIDLCSIGEPWDCAKGKFKQLMSIPHSGAMHRNSLFNKVGNFDENFRIAGDYELLLRELKTADAYFMHDIVTIAMRQGGKSSSPENTLIQLREVRRAQIKHLKNLPSIRWIMAMIKVYLRKFLWLVLGEKIARCLLDIARRLVGLPAYWTKT